MDVCRKHKLSPDEVKEVLAAAAKKAAHVEGIAEAGAGDGETAVSEKVLGKNEVSNLMKEIKKDRLKVYNKVFFKC